MKTQTKANKLVFNTNSIVELKQDELLTLNGGTGGGIVSGDNVLTILTGGAR